MTFGGWDSGSGFQATNILPIRQSGNLRSPAPFHRIIMSKTNWSSQSKKQSGWSQPGDGTYTFKDPISVNDPDILVNEGECLVNGPLRITAYSAGKEKNIWS